MIELTQERREELIKWSKEHIKYLKQDTKSTYSKNCIDSLEIALASLTTSALGRVNRGYVSDNNEYPDAKVDCIHSQAGWENFQDGALLYAAPPVPEIKFPSNPQDAFEEGSKIPSDTQRCGTSYCVSTFHSWKGEEFMHQFEGFLKGINYVKRLNGLGE